MWADQTAEKLRRNTDDGADHNEEKNGEIILEVHAEAFLNDRLIKHCSDCSTASRNPGFEPSTRIVRLETTYHVARVAVRPFEARCMTGN
jgi:hypothetical protein